LKVIKAIIIITKSAPSNTWDRSTNREHPEEHSDQQRNRQTCQVSARVCVCQSHSQRVVQDSTKRKTKPEAVDS